MDIRLSTSEVAPKDPSPYGLKPLCRNALWQADFCELSLVGQKLYLLVILDDFSRFCVGHSLCDGPSNMVAVETLKKAMARHGKPEAIRTDRAGAFVASKSDDDFARFLEVESIDHIVGRAYHPQGGGKVESLIGTIRRELWDVEHLDDRHAVEQRLQEFFDHYNHRRAHMGIDGLCPADRYYGIADRVLATMNAISRKRQSALMPQGQQIEELATLKSGSPMEVLRLCIVDGIMELRFCGARLNLGRIEE
jgi:transposase InsO family protein